MLSSLYTALSGMDAQRHVLDTTAHNIANQSTEGYHRQRVDLAPASLGAVTAVFAGQGSQAAGVKVEGVTRIADDLAEDRLLLESARYADASASRTDLERIELVFPEPSDNGIASMIDEFWSGFSDLAAFPTDTASRTQVLERAQTMIDGLNRGAAELDLVAQTAGYAVSSAAVDINDLAQQLADLNEAIVSGGPTANDLTDQRGVVLRELAELTGAVARPAAGGQIDVSIGGRALVSGKIVHEVSGTGGVLTWESDGAAVAAPSGRVGALNQTINDVVPRYRAALDSVAESLVTEVNALHQVGYDENGATGWDFFDPAGVTASSIQLSADVVGQPGRIAAGAPVLPGPVAPGAFDGEQARALANLSTLADGPDTRYKSMIAELGVEVRAAIRRETIQTDVTNAAEASAQSVGGVSIDEEMATLMASQRAYEASARVLTTIDEVLGVLLERTGRVGR